MRYKKTLFLLPIGLCVLYLRAWSQTVEVSADRSTSLAATSPTVVPMLIRYDGVATRGDNSPATGKTNITFVIYKEPSGGDPLWIETQSVETDAAGRYWVYLGSTYSSGLPANLFGSGEARWLEVQITGQVVGPRTLLTSVPYALKAADAATLGGLPASAFALAGTTATAAITGGGVTSDAASNVTTTGGTSLYVPRFNGTSTVVSSQIYDNGTSVGIGDVPNASARLDVNGAMIMRGNMQVTRTGNATTSTGYPSYGFQFYSNAYNSSTKAGDNPYFQLQSEPTGNNTASPAATFNLLFSNNGKAAAETGFYINPNGTIHFATGQTFPGSGGSGTITGVTAGTGLTGGGTSGNVTLNVDTTAVPTLSATNTFTGSNIFGPSIYENTDVNIDNTNSNSGQLSPGLRLGSASGEGIASRRTSGGNQYGLDFYTGYISRLGINSSGLLGIGAFSGNVQFNIVSSIGYAQALAGYYDASQKSGYAGLFSHGALTDLSAGATAGYGGEFFGGDADTAEDAGYGIYAIGGAGEAEGSGRNFAGSFFNDISVNGATISDASRTEIDHPSDPANKYLVHASVQSSEMMNLYSGNVTTDAAGHATVALPAWFEAENADFRYQITVIGQQAQAWVAKKVGSGEFKIASSPANVEVSWQITAVRQDAFAKAHPLIVEPAKPAREVGFYRHPELFGQPANRQTEWGRNPRMMQRIEAQRAAEKARGPHVSKTAAASVPQ